ncbi:MULTISPECIES: prephenate dehydratase [Lachnospira]|jgi:chorismate mutase/prephenate dehydratase|uniref:Bifunctional chorismate mutase/prephenate dehydratase n=1 Tax=Lachnospira multipara TaxID=28051 RepID=A0A1H5UDC1_9FIRM|nr:MULTISPECIES: prephenate dehydratase [Lachnospira]SEF73030.1 chorismate mutase / prephenate dehydratase [Lachnospira multipara]
MLDLGEIRKNIDGIDRQLVSLFEERMRLTSQVAEYKIETGKKVLDPERERQKLEAIKSLVEKEDNKHPIADLFSQIMANSRKGQYMLLEKMGQTLREPYEAVDEIKKEGAKVVYQGVAGAYAYAAMLDYFGEDVDNFNVPTWKDAMEAVKEGKADYAVLPIENSTTGSITAVYDLLQEYNNYIVAEVYVKVEHVLMGLKGTDLSKVTTVYSHAQGLTQCESFLESHKDWQQISQPNTAVAAKKIFEDKDNSHVAIASKEAAKLYGLEILKTDIADEANNTTRFVIVSKTRTFVKNAKKTSIVFECVNEPGSLYNLLSHIIYNGLNMTKIESRPIEGRQWEFRFFVDIEGNINDQRVMNALRGIEEESRSIRLLGNY